jgi:shikimate kinase
MNGFATASHRANGFLLQDNFSSLSPSAGGPPALRVVCLAGFMGSGKSTVGPLLARQLGWRFEDLDARIEEHAGLSIQAIFERLGEPAFRQVENEQMDAAIGRALETRDPVVIALGGGTYAQPGRPERLRAAGILVIWLDSPVELLLARCATMSNRPLFRDEASFRALLAARLPFYAQADHRVDADTEPPRVVERVLALPPFERFTGIAPELSSRRVRS